MNFLKIQKMECSPYKYRNSDNKSHFYNVFQWDIDFKGFEK